MTVPQMPRGVLDLSKLAQPPSNPAPAPSGPPCSRCGQPMPELPDELAALVRSNPGIALTHELCPGETPAGPEGRYFEVRCQIVELTGDAADPRSEELITFRSGLRAANLDTAMRPLALALGEKWQKAEKQAAIADTPAGS